MKVIFYYELEKPVVIATVEHHNHICLRVAVKEKRFTYYGTFRLFWMQ